VELLGIDSPLVKDSHSKGDLTGPYYGAALTGGGSFRGAAIHRSSDAVSWTQVDALDERVLGGFVTTAADALPEHFAYQTDHETELILVPFDDDSADALESITDAQFLSERNAAWWGNPTDGWEIVKYRDAVDNGDGTWTLSTLIRARRGTARIASQGHAAGDRFYLLNPGQDSSMWGKESSGSSDVGQIRHYRATPLGHPFEAVNFQDVSITGTDLKPYEVVHVESQRDTPSTNDVRLSWIRQTRIGGQSEWGDGVTDTPLGEASERYEVVLLGGPGHASPGSEALSKSVQDQTDTTGSDFTAAEQSAAGYSLSDPLSFVIYQLSVAVGRGFPRTFTVPGI
jgi:hypothetical protein